MLTFYMPFNRITSLKLNLLVLLTINFTIFIGKTMATNKICGVSILRAGETMEQAFSDVCKDIRIGKILIQTNFHTGEPEVLLFS